MASLKQCDRCKRTWQPEPHHYDETDHELCLVQINKPRDPNKYNSSELSKVFELCQACLRLIIAHLEMSDSLDSPS